MTERKALLAAFVELVPDNARVATFAEAMNDGVAVATAAKFAAKIEAPKAEVAPATPKTATEQAADALMAKHAPNVSDDGGSAERDPKAARLAELQGSMKHFNQSAGYAAQ